MVDYIQLLASDLALGKFDNKEMLIKGFLLIAIIQGEVWHVDYMNPAGSAKAGKTGDTKKLLLNASKIAAYAMTYRMGASKDGGAPVADGAGYKKDGTKEEYEYNGGPALNRQGAITKLGSTTNKLQSNALVDAWFILFHAHKSTPSNPAKGTIKADAEIYGKMYTGTTKNTSVQKIALQGWPQGIAGENAMLFKLDIDGQTALSPMRHR